MLQADALVGTWDLLAFTVALPNGTALHPMGEDARGRLMYGADGRMAAMLSEATRTPLSTPRLEAYGKAPDAEKVAAFDSHLSYAGRFTVEGEVVVHHVEFASVPNIVGLEQRRDALLEGDTLTLRYAVTSRRGTRHNILRWRRA